MKRRYLFFVSILAVALFFVACPPNEPNPPMPPEQDCISFDPDQAEVQDVQGRWKIVVGGTWLLDFKANEGEARKALSIIKHYAMNQQCFVGRPDPSMMYFRK